MAFSYGFYNSKNGDKRYDARQIGEMFDGLILDGVFSSVGNHFMVRASDDGKGVIVGSGRAWFNHTWCKNDSDLYFELTSPDLTGSRYDALVIDINSDIQVRKNSIMWVQGTPVIGSTPNKPTMIHTEIHNQYPLCYIYRRANIYTITNSDIENTIGYDVCPFVTAPLEHMSADEILNQIKTEYREQLEILFNNYETDITQWISFIKENIDDDSISNIISMLDDIYLSDKLYMYKNGRNSSDNIYMPASKIQLGVIEDKKLGIKNIYNNLTDINFLNQYSYKFTNSVTMTNYPDDDITLYNRLRITRGVYFDFGNRLDGNTSIPLDPERDYDYFNSVEDALESERINCIEGWTMQHGYSQLFGKTNNVKKIKYLFNDDDFSKIKTIKRKRSLNDLFNNYDKLLFKEIYDATNINDIPNGEDHIIYDIGNFMPINTNNGNYDIKYKVGVIPDNLITKYSEANNLTENENELLSKLKGAIIFCGYIILKDGLTIISSCDVTDLCNMLSSKTRSTKSDIIFSLLNNIDTDNIDLDAGKAIYNGKTDIYDNNIKRSIWTKQNLVNILSILNKSGSSFIDDFFPELNIEFDDISDIINYLETEEDHPCHPGFTNDTDQTVSVRSDGVPYIQTLTMSTMPSNKRNIYSDPEFINDVFDISECQIEDDIECRAYPIYYHDYNNPSPYNIYVSIRYEVIKNGNIIETYNPSTDELAAVIHINLDEYNYFLEHWDPYISSQNDGAHIPQIVTSNLSIRTSSDIENWLESVLTYYKNVNLGSGDTYFYRIFNIYILGTKADIKDENETYKHVDNKNFTHMFSNRRSPGRTNVYFYNEQGDKVINKTKYLPLFQTITEPLKTIGYVPTENEEHKSFGIGYNTLGKGEHALSIGQNTISDGDDQFVMGKFNKVNKNRSLIIGNGNSDYDIDRKNIYEIDWFGNVFTKGATYSRRGICKGLLVNSDGAPVFDLEDGAQYMLILNCRTKSNSAYRSFQQYWVNAPFDPNGVGLTTTSLAAPQVVNGAQNGTTGVAGFNTNLRQEYTAYKPDGTEVTAYHARLGIGSCTTDCWFQWTWVKVGGSVDDFEEEWSE
jgi:hypothetical protein